MATKIDCNGRLNAFLRWRQSSVLGAARCSCAARRQHGNDLWERWWTSNYHSGIVFKNGIKQSFHADVWGTCIEFPSQRIWSFQADGVDLLLYDGSADVQTCIVLSLFSPRWMKNIRFTKVPNHPPCFKAFAKSSMRKPGKAFYLPGCGGI